MRNMSKLLCSHHPTETPISNHIGCRLYGQQGMYSIHTMRGGCVRSTLSQKLLLRWLRYFARTIDMTRQCELSKMGPWQKSAVL